ncbi:MAG: hypothetical protein ABI323_03180 [Solirubrobacteraceae bacterium]
MRDELLTIPAGTGQLDTVLERMSVGFAATDPDLPVGLRIVQGYHLGRPAPLS